MEILYNSRYKYDLFRKQTIFRRFTKVAFFYRSRKPLVKKSGPIDIDGERLRKDFVTGEIRNYKKSECEPSIEGSLKRSYRSLDTLLKMNDFNYFCTLTFDKTKVARYDNNSVFVAYRKFINNVKHHFPNLTYITVVEKHTDGCHHFHMLLGNVDPQELDFTYSGKVCCSWVNNVNKVCSEEFYNNTKDLYIHTATDGEKIFNIGAFSYGFTTATRICDYERCCTYVKKYIDKSFCSTEKWEKRFYYSSNLKVPRYINEEIGSDFNEPVPLENRLFYLSALNDTKNYKPYYNADYNYMQYEVPNDKKEDFLLLSNGSQESREKANEIHSKELMDYAEKINSKPPCI